MKPVLPMEPVIGQYLFFADPKQGDQIVLYGKVIGRDGAKWRLKISNSVGCMSFDPKTGQARPRANVLDCVWIAGEEMRRLNYNDQLALAKDQMAGKVAAPDHSDPEVLTKVAPAGMPAFPQNVAWRAPNFGLRGDGSAYRDFDDPFHYADGKVGGEPLFTADQMVEYARAHKEKP